MDQALSINIDKCPIYSLLVTVIWKGMKEMKSTTEKWVGLQLERNKARDCGGWLGTEKQTNPTMDMFMSSLAGFPG